MSTSTFMSSVVKIEKSELQQCNFTCFYLQQTKRDERQAHLQVVHLFLVLAIVKPIIHNGFYPRRKEDKKCRL